MEKSDIDKLLNNEIELRKYLWLELQKALIELIIEIDTEIDREFLEGTGTGKPIGLLSEKE